MLRISKAMPTEKNGKPVSLQVTTFSNWGKSVISPETYIFAPTSLQGAANVIRWASEAKKTVRTVGYAHTWASLYSDQVLIYMLDPNIVHGLPSIHLPLNPLHEFQQIKLVGAPFKEKNQWKHLCKIGAGVTNEQFRAWSVGLFLKGHPSWTVPLNVIMVENTFGGTNALMCHGAGIHNKTLSDLVTAIEFINPLGLTQKIDINESGDQKPSAQEIIKSAAGSLGLLGTITSLTLTLDAMTHARMLPQKTRLMLTIPPPADFKLPPNFPVEMMKGITKKDLRQAENQFYKQCETAYYAEWFWFIFNENCWVNTWKNNGSPSLSEDYPKPLQVKSQELEEYQAHLINESIMKWVPPKWQVQLISEITMLLLPHDEEIITPLPDALHFRRGIQNMPVQDMEFEIPIPARLDGKPDWRVCQLAFWQAIETIYEWEQKSKYPARLTLEMRIMGGSDITLAPQYNNALGTCSIEILTLQPNLVPKAEWHAFLQNVLDKWASITSEKGESLNIRPHWAKQWEGLSITRKEKLKPILQYLKEDAYKDVLPIFKSHLTAIAEQGGFKVEDFKLFSNPLLNYLIFDEKAPNSPEIKLDNTPPSLADKNFEQQVQFNLLFRRKNAIASLRQELEDVKSTVPIKRQNSAHRMFSFFDTLVASDKEKIKQLKQQKKKFSTDEQKCSGCVIL